MKRTCLLILFITQLKIQGKCLPCLGLAVSDGGASVDKISLNVVSTVTLQYNGMLSIATFGQLYPLLDLLLLLLALTIIHYLPEQLLHQILHRLTRLLLRKLHCVRVVFVVVAHVKTSDHIVQRILRLGSENKPIDTIDDLPECQCGTVVAIEY